MRLFCHLPKFSLNSDLAGRIVTIILVVIPRFWEGTLNKSYIHTWGISPSHKRLSLRYSFFAPPAPTVDTSMTVFVIIPQSYDINLGIGSDSFSLSWIFSFILESEYPRTLGILIFASPKPRSSIILIKTTYDIPLPLYAVTGELSFKSMSAAINSGPLTIGLEGEP